jgi:hypothetical protein
VQDDWPAPSVVSERPEVDQRFSLPMRGCCLPAGFWDPHCIAVEPQSTGASENNGVVAQFKPAKGIRKNAALEGALEFDRRSLVLRSLSFQFAARPRWAPKKSAGGEIRFAPLPDGAWIPIQWEMRVPIPTVTGNGQRYRLFGVLEVGGKVTGVRGPRWSAGPTGRGSAPAIQLSSGSGQATGAALDRAHRGRLSLRAPCLAAPDRPCPIAGETGCKPGPPNL